MSKSPTPPVTEDEVVAVLTIDDDQPRVLGTSDVAFRVWIARGGTGVYPPGRDHAVPVVRGDHVRPVLDRLVDAGTVAHAPGHAANRLGRVFGGARANGHYYTLAEYARQVAEDADRLAAARDRAAEAARALREGIGDRVRDVTATAEGAVTITCTGEQALALLAALRERA